MGELAAEKFNKYDKDNSKSLEYLEFLACLSDYMSDAGARARFEGQTTKARAYIPATDDDEDEEEIPEDLASLPQDQIMRRIAFRATWKMMLGTFVVLFVSDPFVDVLNVWGKVFQIPVFYV